MTLLHHLVFGLPPIKLAAEVILGLIRIDIIYIDMNNPSNTHLRLIVDKMSNFHRVPHEFLEINLSILFMFGILTDERKNQY